ncbi:MAG: hypothetical protein JXB49_13090 [Bacteroidales bacterium]|nr:hypothetical protein [Bacteroidales bacterium]
MKISVIYSHELHRGIIEGFKDLGHEVEEKYFGMEPHKFSYTIYSRILIKIFGANRILRHRFNRKIQELITEGKRYSLLLFIKPKRISKSKITKLQKLKGNLKIVIWTTDTVSRSPEQLCLKNITDKIFVQDGLDLKNNHFAIWLPLGYDAKLFKPADSQKNIDILMVGNCKEPQYRTRAEYFVEASKLAIYGFRIVYIGSNLNAQKLEIMHKNGVETHSRMKLVELAQFIRNSKICINIHQDDGNKVLNPLFFAIPACNTIQVTEERDYFSQWLTPMTDYFPYNLHFLVTGIKELLNNYGSDNLYYQSIQKYQDHTFLSRANSILNVTF